MKIRNIEQFSEINVGNHYKIKGILLSYLNYSHDNESQDSPQLDSELTSKEHSV
jgi:hypothetical protein